MCLFVTKEMETHRAHSITNFIRMETFIRISEHMLENVDSKKKNFYSRYTREKTKSLSLDILYKVFESSLKHFVCTVDTPEIWCIL
jgi:hypothetical protein